VQGECIGIRIKVENCEKECCPVWSEWVKGECSVTCGHGVASATRICLKGNCIGEKAKIESCEEKEVCPVWSEWVKGRCSVTCGKGIVTYTRNCLQGLGCTGTKNKVESCQEECCPVWSDWVKGECKIGSCGKGIVTSTRSCLQGTCTGLTIKTEHCELYSGCGSNSNVRINLLFAIDGSGSVSSTNFIKQKNFIKSIVDKLDIKRFSFGLLQYSDKVDYEFPVVKGRTIAEIKNLIDAVSQLAGGTHTHLAIKHGRNIFSGLTYDLKNDRNVFLFTNDGGSSYPELIEGQVLLMDSEAKVPTTRYAVGVTASVIDELNQIASSPDKAIYGPTFDDFPSFVDTLATSFNGDGCGNETSTDYNYNNYIGFNFRKQFYDIYDQLFY